MLAEGFGMLERNVLANITGGANVGSFGGIMGNAGGFSNFFGNILKWVVLFMLIFHKIY